MVAGLRMPELLVILVIVLLLFGVGRVANVGKELGSAISEFRNALNQGKDGEEEENGAQGEPL